jgi:hypothetical protein
VRYSTTILIAVLIAAMAGFQTSRLPHVNASLPAWFWPVFWIVIAGTAATVPILWWLDL